LDWCEIELLHEDANRKWNCAHQKSTHCEKRVVLDGRRDKTNNMKAQLYCVTHEMCRKREKERKRERPINCSILSHLKLFQLLFNLNRDILSLSLT
jgi:hypothetical protein